MKPLAIAIFIFCVLLGTGCRQAAAPVSVSNRTLPAGGMPQTNVPAQPRKPLTEMTWASLDGQATTLETYKGKAVILDFWATYCPPCRDEIPHLNELQAKYGVNDLQVVGLNVGGDEDRPKIPAFAKQYKISYPIAFPDNDLEAYVFAESDSIPQTAVFDRNGQLVKKFVGFDASLKPELEAAIQTALESK